MLGSWFGIDRNGLSDTDYRDAIISRKASNLTIAGIRTAISKILNIDPSTISFTNADSGCLVTKRTVIASKQAGSPTLYSGQYKKEAGVLNITLHHGSNVSLVQTALADIVLSGVITWVVAS